MATTESNLRDVAGSAVKAALKKGAVEAAGRAYRVREVQVTWRDGKLEKIHEATTRGLGITLYVDGRYSTANSSDLRPEALETFIAEAVALTRTLAKDPFRSLPDPKLYEGQAKLDLQLEDPKYAAVTPEERRRTVKEIEAAARNVKGNEAIISVTTNFSDTLSESWRVASNGFSGGQRGTNFFMSAEVSAKEADGRKPEDYAYAGARFFRELPEVTSVGREAAERTIRFIGSKKADSAVLTMVLENRAAGRMMAFLQSPLSGAALQQKRSFYEGKLGQAVGSPLLTVTDDPLLPKGFGSRLFDAEGLAAKTLPVFESGVLRNYFIDTYYGKKLGVTPTTGGTSNARWALGTKGRIELVRGIDDGILVTSFLGGNSNETTGDFSLGVRGFRIRKGEVAEPVSEMNISGNHLEFWKRLTAVGNDPYPYSSLRTPTLVFDGVQFAGI